MTQTMTTNTLSHLSARQEIPLMATLAIRFAGLVTTWDTRHRSRKKLKSLEWHLVSDIGRTLAEAMNEARKPFWRA